MGAAAALTMIAIGSSAGAQDVQDADAGFQPIGGEVIFTVGALGLTEDFDDRFISTAGANVYFDSGLGFHGEATYADREEDGALFIAGVSYNTPQSQFRVSAGSSTDVEDIFPELYIRGDATLRSSPADGLVGSAGVTYRDYRNGADEVVLDGNVTKYIAYGGGEALILQSFGSIGLADPGSNVSYSIGGSIGFNSLRDYSFAVALEGGRSEYDLDLGLEGISNPFLAVRPSAGLYLTNSIEVFVRGEFVTAEIYDVYGGTVGLKIEFPQ